MCYNQTMSLIYRYLFMLWAMTVMLWFIVLPVLGFGIGLSLMRKKWSYFLISLLALFLMSILWMFFGQELMFFG